MVLYDPYHKELKDQRFIRPSAFTQMFLAPLSQGVGVLGCNLLYRTGKLMLKGTMSEGSKN